MAETIEELSYDYEDNGRLVRRELKREVLSKGAWCTIMFLFQELDRKSDTWRAPKIAIVRYKKWNGVYRKQSGFNISSEKQARAIVGAIEMWYAEGAVHDPPPREEPESDDVPADDAAEDAPAEDAEEAPAE
jgi:hypothetical protein